MTKEENIKEIDEAIYAGNRALNALNEAQNNLSVARGMGIWDILGGGLISGVIKHSKMGAAQRCMEQAERELASFQRELADVKMNANYRIDFDGLSKFLDLVFDNFLVDLLIQSRIKEVQERVSRVKMQVEQTINNLYQMRSDIERTYV